MKELSRIEKVKEFFHFSPFGLYVEYNEKGKIIYKEYPDGDWCIGDYNGNDVIFDYVHFSRTNCVEFMNIICHR